MPWPSSSQESSSPRWPGGVAAARSAAFAVLLLLSLLALPQDGGQLAAVPALPDNGQVPIVVPSQRVVASRPAAVLPVFVAAPARAEEAPVPPSPEPPPPPPPRPVRLLIPTLGVDAAVEDVGITAAGAMGTPRNIWSVGWFSPGPVPGGPGDAVLDGHLGLPGSPLVFAKLGRLGPGDLIIVVGEDGTRLTFSVTGTARWPLNSHPTGLFATDGLPRLSLITCDGTYLRNVQTYADRLVVEAALAPV